MVIIVSSLCINNFLVKVFIDVALKESFENLFSYLNS